MGCFGARGAVRGAGTRWSDGLVQILLEAHSSLSRGLAGWSRFVSLLSRSSRLRRSPGVWGQGSQGCSAALASPVPLLRFHQQHPCPETAEKAELITKINHPRGTGANLQCQNWPWVQSGSAMGAVFTTSQGSRIPHLGPFPGDGATSGKG